MLSEMSRYVWRFNETEYIFLIKDDKLFKKYQKLR